MRFSESSEKQILKLITGLELADRKPTQLLREMRTLAGQSVSDEVLTTLWLQRMPNNFRCILSACKNQDVDDLAEIADRIMDNSPSSSYVMAAAPRQTDNLENRVRALETTLHQLVAQMADLSSKLTERRQHVENPRQMGNQPAYRGRSPSRNRNKICHFHIRFGGEAKKCVQPCEFSKIATYSHSAKAPEN
ncbi:hypothetical protein PSTG_18683 [Puccinia striiformis f. sp. tritici PST-78]|uniref:Uncharacterized protein n=1 Tax=Puccinia striiformis f. sp. tritici PST-78 TaxID=1165861 RepID=A0A0L0ULM5_9BASI|nr:hypothetical protein PSTG_18683 [Puccinia striiformis f. sp. tritici PST-78]